MTMPFFRKKPTKKVRVSRIQKMSTPDLISWADVVIMHLGRSFDQWRYKEGDIEEVRSHVTALTDILAEIEDRANG
jgi:hypothetical protein